MPIDVNIKNSANITAAKKDYIFLTLKAEDLDMKTRNFYSYIFIYIFEPK